MSAQARSQVRDLLERHGVTPSKAHGQHFLVDPNITRKIAGLARVGPEDGVVEIGAGTGTLSLALAETGARVVAYEIDHHLEPILREVLAGTAVELRMEDAAEVDLGSALDRARRWVMVANLPYNVGTPILLDALRHAPVVERFVVMVQAEVAERLAARPGSAAYGLPSVVVAIHGSARVEFSVPPQVFLPPPNVGSAVVSIDRAAGAPPGAERAVALAAAGFGQRRKMVRRSLSSLLDDPIAALERAGIAPTSRAEELSAAQWLALAEAAP